MNKLARKAAEILSSGVVHLQSGHISAAKQSFRKLLKVAPGNLDGLVLLGTASNMSGHYADAVDLLERALNKNPNHLGATYNLGVALQALGQLEQALKYYDKAVALAPRLIEAILNRAVVLQELGHFDDALVRLQEARAVRPELPEIHNQLGSLFIRQKRWLEAESSLVEALRLRADYLEALNNLGVALRGQGRLDAAIAYCTQALSKQPTFIAARDNLAQIFYEMGRLDDALVERRKLAQLYPEDGGIQAGLGGLLLKKGLVDESIDACQKAIALDPALLDAYLNLSVAFCEKTRLYDAVACCKYVLSHNPDNASAYYNLGNALLESGRQDEAVNCYRKSRDINPHFSYAHSNLLMSLQYSERGSNLELFTEAVHFARHVEPANPTQEFRNTLNLHRPLRIGYVSPDFRNHPVGFFLIGVLKAHDRTNFEVICYSNSHITDTVTMELRAAADGWRTIVDMSDSAVATLIASDEIDILVDLSGHTGGNRLQLFAMKPAPVQVTWMGYSDTTGLSAMDYILADRFIVPSNEEVYFVEKVWRMPDCFLSFSPPALDISVGALPALANGFVTFGSFNNRSKITAATVAAWAEILTRIENSRLFLKTKSFADATCRKTLLSRFADYGIAGNRLVLEGSSPRADALAAYNRVDIALDTFPYGGVTTTAEALLMGVPVVTQCGARWVARVSQGILVTLGLNDWVSEDTDHYVETACRMAADLQSLAVLRSDLRQRLESSAFCDGPQFTAALEAAYRGMWSAWCGGRLRNNRNVEKPN